MSEAFQVFLVELARQGIPFLAENLFELVLIPLVIAAIQFVKSRLSAARFEQVKSVVRTLVLAAEQSGFKDALLEQGNQKRQWVLAEADRILREQGLDKFADNTPLLNAVLEAEVYESLNKAVLAIGDAIAEIEVVTEGAQ